MIKKMDKSEIIEQLAQIIAVKTESNNNSFQLIISNELKDYTITIDCDDVIFTRFISSPMNENCLQIFFSDEGGIIVTPNDFVFNVEQDEFVKVNNLPPLCSISEMVLGFESYKKNPNPSVNIDNNFGLFYLHYYIFKSAIKKGFHVPMLADLYNIGLENGFLLNNKEDMKLFNGLS
jgi:hypothetical protein